MMKTAALQFVEGQQLIFEILMSYHRASAYKKTSQEIRLSNADNAVMLIVSDLVDGEGMQEVVGLDADAIHRSKTKVSIVEAEGFVE